MNSDFLRDQPSTSNSSSSSSKLKTRQILLEKSKIRKQLLAKSLGHNHFKQLIVQTPPSTKVVKTGNLQLGLGLEKTETIACDEDVLVIAKQEETSQLSPTHSHSSHSDHDEKVMLDDYFKVLQEEEKVYRGSATFLKGTQSANPHNDYSQNYVDKGQAPANFIRDPSVKERYLEYPKLKELIELKDQLVLDTATPPMYLSTDLSTFNLHDLGSRFDVILIEPPLAEYNLTTVLGAQQSWDWDMIEQLDIPAVADARCFVWIWCGATPNGTSRARQCLRKWGFRRCEDICWVKQNLRQAEHPSFHARRDPNALFKSCKEHCLMGIRGTVRRSTDGHFIHANVDIDLIIQEDTYNNSKPEEIFNIAEHFCLGRRRLHLFARDDTLRPGWVSVGPALTTSNFDRRTYRTHIDQPPGLTTGCTDRITLLRPKSPERNMPGNAMNRRPMNMTGPGGNNDNSDKPGQMNRTPNNHNQARGGNMSKASNNNSNVRRSLPNSSQMGGGGDAKRKSDGHGRNNNINNNGIGFRPSQGLGRSHNSLQHMQHRRSVNQAMTHVRNQMQQQRYGNARLNHHHYNHMNNRTHQIGNKNHNNMFNNNRLQQNRTRERTTNGTTYKARTHTQANHPRQKRSLN